MIGDAVVVDSLGAPGLAPFADLTVTVAAPVEIGAVGKRQRFDEGFVDRARRRFGVTGLC